MISKDVDEIKRYKQFLIALDNYSPMARVSRCNINYNISKINLLLGNEIDAKTYFIKSIDLDKKCVTKMLKYDVNAEKFVSKVGLMK